MASFIISNMRIRFVLIITFFLFLYGVLIFNLYQIQIQKGETYSAQAESQLKLAGLLEPKRGGIYFTDKNGLRVAATLNKDFPFVYAIPKKVDDPSEAAELLSGILGKPASTLRKSLSKEGDPYEPLLAKASKVQEEEIKKLKLEGVYVSDEPGRYYPLANLGSHVVGFVSAYNSEDEKPAGQYGIEKFYNNKLFGKPGEIDGDFIIKSESGENINLTIDRLVQDKATEIIRKLIEEYGAKSASFIVEEPKTGKIIAMGALPDFDPNLFSSFDIKTFLNPNTQSVYEPGSVFKIFTMAAGIDSGSITPETTYYDSGAVTLNGYTIKNWDLKSHGTMTMANVIEKSLNTGTIFAEKQTGHKVFYSYLEDFGFKEKTGIDLPGEVVGSLAPLETKNIRDVNFATASFGQGISVTPIQLIRAASVIANGGVMTDPYLNAGAPKSGSKRVISADTAKKVTEMMVSAVDKAAVAKINNYKVAGKTGTAYIPNFKSGGYTDDVINTYIGFAPASNPKFTILIKLDKPAGAPVAGLTVVPAFRELAEFMLSYYNIPPDRIEN